MSMASSGTDRTMPVTKKRNPWERAFVWGLIAVLGVLVIVESCCRYSYQRAYNSLGDRLTAAHELGPDALNAAQVKAYLKGREPSRTEVFPTQQRQVSNGATHLEVYSWFTLNPFSTREIFIYYDASGPGPNADPVVVSIQPAEEEIVSYAGVVPTQADPGMLRRAMKDSNGVPPSTSKMPELLAPMKGFARGTPPLAEKQPDAKREDGADQTSEDDPAAIDKNQER
jgi:hypothetical protein